MQSKFFLKVECYMGRVAGNIDFMIYVDGVLKNVKNVTLGNVGAAGIGIGMIGVEKIGQEGGSMTIDDSGGSIVVELAVNKMGRNLQVEIQDNTGDKSWELNALEISYVPINSYFQPNVK